MTAMPMPSRPPSVPITAAAAAVLPAPQLSVVIPAHDEADNLGPLLDEIAAALDGVIEHEIIVVDDASSDATPTVLAGRGAAMPRLRVLRHTRQAGQSTALRNGVRAARGAWIATLDADGQNDPADIPKLWKSLQQGNPDRLKLLQGWRTTRRDSATKRISSRIANAVRSRLLGDSTPDSGCGIRLIERDTLLSLPYFDHMHRFIPALVRQAGWDIVSVPVGHRERRAGSTHYGMWNRLWVGIVDLIGVAWLGRRHRLTRADELPIGDRPAVRATPGSTETP